MKAGKLIYISLSTCRKLTLLHFNYYLASAYVAT